MERLERICGNLDRTIRNRLLQIRLQAEIRGFLRGNDTKSGIKSTEIGKQGGKSALEWNRLSWEADR